MAGVEAIVLILGALLLLPTLDGQRLLMGATSMAFFLLYGAGLAWCAWQLSRLRAWARAPVVMSQLIHVLVAAGFWGGATTWIAVLAIGASLLVLAGVFHPASLRAVEIAQDPQ